MNLVKFSMPIASNWDSQNTIVNDQTLHNIGLTEAQVLDKYKEVFTVLGRLKVEPLKIHLTKDAV